MSQVSSHDHEIKSSETSGKPTGRKPLKRLILSLMLIPVFLLVIWAIVSPTLAARHDATKERDPKTGIITGAEARILGPEESDKAILFIHGYTGTPTVFGDFPDKLAEAGWRVNVMLLPGHGTTPFEFEKLTPEDFITAALSEVDVLLDNHDKVVVLGSSMGGAIATLLASQRDLDGLVVSAPGYGVPKKWYHPAEPITILRGISVVLPWVKGSADGQPISNKANAEKVISYSPWFSTKTLITALELCNRAGSTATLENIEEPVLHLHGLKDTVVIYEPTAVSVSKMGSKIKKEHLLPEANHLLFLDYGNEEALVALQEFLANI